VLNNTYLKDYNFLLVTLDSLTYETAMNTETPNIKRWAEKYENRTIEGTPFRKVYTQATFTLPSHVSMFFGLFPDNRRSREPYYNRKLFKPVVFDRESDNRPQGLVFKSAPNMIKGFEHAGYNTSGVGGVGWFDTSSNSTNIWKEVFFQNFYYNKSFHETAKNSITAQAKCVSEIVTNDKGNKSFVFVNISATHSPYLYNGQPYALERFDDEFETFLAPFKSHRPLFLILVSDHGDVLSGAWEQYGQRHAFFVPERALEIMEIPMLIIDIHEW